MGLVMASYLPIAPVGGLTIGIVFAVTNPGQANDPNAVNRFSQSFWWVDLAVGAVIVLLLVLIGSFSKKYGRHEVVRGKLVESPTNFSNPTSWTQSSPSDNPYQPPKF
jgi:hypothetical protein